MVISGFCAENSISQKLAASCNVENLLFMLVFRVGRLFGWLVDLPMVLVNNISRGLEVDVKVRKEIRRLFFEYPLSSLHHY